MQVSCRWHEHKTVIISVCSTQVRRCWAGKTDNVLSSCLLTWVSASLTLFLPLLRQALISFLIWLLLMVLTLVHVNPCSTEDDRLHTHTDKNTLNHLYILRTHLTWLLLKKHSPELTCSDFPALRLQFPRLPRRRTTQPEENKNTECDDVGPGAAFRTKRCVSRCCILSPAAASISSCWVWWRQCCYLRSPAAEREGSQWPVRLERSRWSSHCCCSRIWSEWGCGKVRLMSLTAFYLCSEVTKVCSI